MYQMLFAGEDGSLFDYPALGAVGRTGGRYVELLDSDLEELPEGASLTLIPRGTPLGIGKGGRFTTLEQNPFGAGRAWAVGALLPQGYTRTMLPAYLRDEAAAPLPLFGYAAAACRDGKLYGAIRRTDDPLPWDPAHYDTAALPQLVSERLKEMPANRILSHLAHCALAYRCFTAQNIFYRRWEGGIPVSPGCNARCLGCISLQPAECCPSPQERLTFRPTPREVAEIALPHLNLGGPGAMVSFGQGCEGEPSLEALTISEAVERLRGQTDAGVVNMNSNGGYTAGIERICQAGLDTVRISLISAREKVYQAYYRPASYGLADVRRSIRLAAGHGVYVSLNLLVLPGLTDQPEEVAALTELIRETGVALVQMRNLNIDPDWLLSNLPEDSAQGEPIGIDALIAALEALPGVKVGSYSHPVKRS